jgi:hypothetical protein
MISGWQYSEQIANLQKVPKIAGAAMRVGRQGWKKPAFCM